MQQRKEKMKPKQITFFNSSTNEIVQVHVGYSIECFLFGIFLGGPFWFFARKMYILGIITSLVEGLFLSILIVHNLGFDTERTFLDLLGQYKGEILFLIYNFVFWLGMMLSANDLHIRSLTRKGFAPVEIIPPTD